MCLVILRKSIDISTSFITLILIQYFKFLKISKELCIILYNDFFLISSLETLNYNVHIIPTANFLNHHSYKTRQNSLRFLTAFVILIYRILFENVIPRFKRTMYFDITNIQEYKFRDFNRKD